MTKEIVVVEPGHKGRQCIIVVGSRGLDLDSLGLDSGSPVYQICNSVQVSIFQVS